MLGAEWLLLGAEWLLLGWKGLRRLQGRGLLRQSRRWIPMRGG